MNLNLARYSYFFIYLVLFNNCFVSTRDPKSEFSTYNYVDPLFEDADGSPLSLKETFPDEIKVILKDAFNSTLILHLSVVNELFPQNYFQKYHSNGSPVVHKPKVEKCHFQGFVAHDPHSWLALSGCNRTLSGTIVTSSETYYIHPEIRGSKIFHLLFRHSDRTSLPGHCGTTDSPTNRVKRSATTYKTDYKTRYLELIIVNDFLEYSRLDKNKEAVIERTKAIANIVNALYRPLNIFVVLVGVIIWTEQDKIVTSNANTTLTNFLKHRKKIINKDHPNDNAQLISGITFENSVVGKALRGPICTYEYSGGVNSDHSDIVGIVASTVAHEIGHNFGMEHDGKDCKCPSQKCIMSDTSGVESIQHWSSCSKSALKTAFKNGMDHCLLNAPEKALFPMCGNGILDEGETCDCGLPEYCDNICCNASTCQLQDHAQCGTGQCCDLETCKYKESGTVCRPALHPECDLPEYCNGKSEGCPRDTYTRFGTPCGSKTGYCYKGQCGSHSSQCQLLWGPTGVPADWQCYTLNAQGNLTGNCGHDIKNNIYIPCSQRDLLCGRLQCIHFSEELNYGTPAAASGVTSTMSIKSKKGTRWVKCQTAQIDLGDYLLDPGMVPNGASCGTDKMCVNAKCVPLSKARTKDCDYNCYDSGICNSNGNCHCFYGRAPPYCNSPGPGGSVDSGPASTVIDREEVVVGILVFFVCVVPLCLLVGCSLYHWRHRLTTCYKKAASGSQIPPRPPTHPPPSQTIPQVRENPLVVHLEDVPGVKIKPLQEPHPHRPAPELPKIPSRSAPPPPVIPSDHSKPHPILRPAPPPPLPQKPSREPDLPPPLPAFPPVIAPPPAAPKQPNQYPPDIPTSKVATLAMKFESS